MQSQTYAQVVKDVYQMSDTILRLVSDEQVCSSMELLPCLVYNERLRNRERRVRLCNVKLTRA